MIEEDIPTFLTGDATVAGLVGSRVYFSRLQNEGSYPAIVYHLISSVRDRIVTGANGRATARFQFDCRAETGIAAKRLAKAVRKRFEDFSGAMGATTVRNTLVDGERDDTFDRDARTYRTILDVVITYDEA